MATFAVVCRWADWSKGTMRSGHEALIVEAADSNAAQLAANAARPDFWEDHGPKFRRTTAVHPATVIPPAPEPDPTQPSATGERETESPSAAPEPFPKALHDLLNCEGDRGEAELKAEVRALLEAHDA